MRDGWKNKDGLQYSLVVTMSRETGWRAAVLTPDSTERVFVSPFELARFLAWPVAATRVLQGGLR